MHGQAHGGMYADGIWEAIGLLDEMDEQMDRTGPLLIGRDFAPDSAWGLFFQNNVRMYAPGIFAVRYLSPVFCDILRVYLKGKAYTVNPEEPLEARIPEVVLEQEAEGAYGIMLSLFEGYMKKLAYILTGLSTGSCVSIQAAKYRPYNTPHGCWHTDRDSEMTLVVALSDDHKGGGTEVYQGPLKETIVVPQLAKGWGMLFPGRTNEHMGLPVTEGTRHLLVHWYALEK